MHQTRIFPYYEDDEIQAVQLPYSGNSVSMTIILPKTREGWKMISQVLDYDGLQKVMSQFREVPVNLSIPKFSTGLNINLNKELAAMGMESAFAQNADFSGMTGEKNLFIDEVMHKAFIEVSENGTEAAAATAAVLANPIPVSDWITLVPIQIGMVIYYGRFLVKANELGSLSSKSLLN